MASAFPYHHRRASCSWIPRWHRLPAYLQTCRPPSQCQRALGRTQQAPQREAPRREATMPEETPPVQLVARETRRTRHPPWRPRRRSASDRFRTWQESAYAVACCARSGSPRPLLHPPPPPPPRRQYHRSRRPPVPLFPGPARVFSCCKLPSFSRIRVSKPNRGRQDDADRSPRGSVKDNNKTIRFIPGSSHRPA